MNVRTLSSPGAGLFERLGDRIIYTPEAIHVWVDGLPWDVEFELAYDQDAEKHEVNDLRIRRRSGGEPLPQGITRPFRLGEAVRQALDAAAMQVEEVESDDRRTRWRISGDNPQSEPGTGLRNQKPRRKALPPLQQIAAAYVDGIAAGESDLSTYVGTKCHISRTSAWRQIQKAKGAGLIPEEAGR